MIHFSIDDFILTLKDLTENEERYDSLCEQPVFAFLQRIHKTYGAVFSCYCFGKDLKSGFTLENVTYKYREEFSKHADWLRFGFHGMDTEAVYGDNGGTRTINRCAKQALGDYEYIVTQLTRIVGEEAIDTVPRIHYFAGTSECCTAWKNTRCGIRGLLAADDDRYSYYHDDVVRTKLINDDVWYDEVRRLYFLRTHIRLENESDLEVLCSKLRTFQGKCQIIFTHECYLEQEEMQAKIELCAQEVAKTGRGFGFP